MPVSVGAKVSPELRDAFYAIARERGVEPSVLLREIIEEYVAHGGSFPSGVFQSRPTFRDIVSRVVASGHPVLGAVEFPAYGDDQLKVSLGYRVLPVPVGDTVYLFFFAQDEFLFAVNVFQLFKALISTSDVLYGYPRFAYATKRYESWLKSVFQTWYGILKDLLSSVGRSEEDK